MDQLKLMAVFAHPDDEAFGMGGSLTKYAAEGHEVHVITATRGEAGEIAEDDLATKANLPDVREAELRCACQVYGALPPQFLNYQDGQLATVHQGQAVGKLVRIFREIRPQVVVTFGPEGIYGHYDHIAVHRWVTIAVKLAADRSCFPDVLPEQCDAFAVQKLYHSVLPTQQVEAMTADSATGGVMMDGVPFPFVGYRADQITTVIDVAQHATAKVAGIRCHVTQVGREGVFGQEPDSVLRAPWFRTESFILAHSTVGFPVHIEDDLFRGVRQGNN